MLENVHLIPRPALPLVMGVLMLLATAGLAPSAAAPQARAAADPRFSWPLAPAPAVTRPFEQPETAYEPGHRGVDLAAAPGQQVLAAGPGVVVFSGQVAGRGVVSIDHDGGLRTTYEPVSPLVAAGAQVFAGQPIGAVEPGHPDCPVAACLHWGVRRGEEYLNPLALIRTESVIRLKPWARSSVPP
ncbi:M23 family metallopeptidase [Amycolatopsis alkalitolerans]|uniref:M23 family metallopeptidase n=1 Tax=Amycolatopsis alkalitolerans TaxID=2547244 RepID=A0A5C4LWY0_9PSEU|nr:M23 family metallopeptidase [Amycolatopsis alkalitolerans]TNC22531.1 M23 family metallopeptidase [Amycolatopsis alkalitolerans]